MSLWRHRISGVGIRCYKRLKKTYDWPFPTLQSQSSASSVNTRKLSSKTESALKQYQDIYVAELDVEDFENYVPGGYYPVSIDDTFQGGRYRIEHKLGYGSYSTIWLARDTALNQYVSIKILLASESSKSSESDILHMLQSSDLYHPGQRFTPQLLDTFDIDGPNGHHFCLVQDVAGLNLAASKEISTNLMFPLETARSIAAQLIRGVACLHSLGICHGDLYPRNMLLDGPDLHEFSETHQLYKRYPLYKVPIRRLDGSVVQPHAPTNAVYPMSMKTSADKVHGPLITLTDFGTSFVVAQDPSPKLHTLPLYLPLEDVFGEPITLAADIWTLGVSLYEIMGERPLFESFSNDQDDILADTISTLGLPPTRWWDKWANRHEFFNSDGSWATNIQRIYTPGFRLLHERIWDMGRGTTAETSEFDVRGRELEDLELLLQSMLAYEPCQRPTAKQLLESEYMTKWAMPAWERQLARIK